MFGTPDKNRDPAMERLDAYYKKLEVDSMTEEDREEYEQEQEELADLAEIVEELKSSEKGCYMDFDDPDDDPASLRAKIKKEIGLRDFFDQSPG